MDNEEEIRAILRLAHLDWNEELVQRCLGLSVAEVRRIAIDTSALLDMDVRGRRDN